MSPPSNGVSEDRVKLMIIDGLKEYERNVVEPRHRETQTDLASINGELATIRGIVQQGKGALSLGGYMLSLASLTWLVLQIIHHFSQGK